MKVVEIEFHWPVNDRRVYSIGDRPYSLHIHCQSLAFYHSITVKWWWLVGYNYLCLLTGCLGCNLSKPRWPVCSCGLSVVVRFALYFTMIKQLSKIKGMVNEILQFSGWVQRPLVKLLLRSLWWFLLSQHFNTVLFTENRQFIQPLISRHPEVIFHRVQVQTVFRGIRGLWWIVLFS